MFTRTILSPPGQFFWETHGLLLQVIFHGNCADFSRALHFDSERYPEPERFNPGRFLGTRALELNAGECINATDVRDRDHWSFGAGRRVCPRYTLAENSLFILTARLLWAFDIQAPADPDTGEWIKPDLWNYRAAQLFGPEPFKVDFKARSCQQADTSILSLPWQRQFLSSSAPTLICRQQRGIPQVSKIPVLK